MKENRDDGELALSDHHVLLSNPDSSTNFQDLIIDEFLKNTTTCTHTHTCNPPGPDAAHTHTCYHTHTQVITSEEDDHHQNIKDSSSLKPRRPSGNREAVRKYREKKKAHAAYLEEEVKKLRMLNQQLVRKLQRQSSLEAEVLRLRSLLIDLRAKMDAELGVFPFQKQYCNNATLLKEGDCGMQSSGESLKCQTDLPCFHPRGVSSSSQSTICGSEKMNISWEGNCQPATISCEAANVNQMASVEGHHVDQTLASSSASQAE